jgi:hypothetical protein
MKKIAVMLFAVVLFAAGLTVVGTVKQSIVEPWQIVRGIVTGSEIPAPNEPSLFGR